MHSTSATLRRGAGDIVFKFYFEKIKADPASLSCLGRDLGGAIGDSVTAQAVTFVTRLH